ncbi:DUF7557 family protein [Haloarcula amylolytica]|jgi:hypothetical protein
MAQSEATTIRVSRDFKQNRLDSLKPFESLTYEEFLAEMADVYEENQQ